MDALARIQRARSILIQDEAFLGVLSMHLAIVEKAAVETMATDGETLWYAPDCVATWNDPELLFVVAHEVMHCGLSHMARIPPHWDMKDANRAADYAINGELIRLRIGTPPKSTPPLYDARFNGMAMEEIYSILQAEKRKAKQDGQNGQGKPAGAGSGQPGQSGAPDAQGKPTGAPGQGNGQPGADGAPGQGEVNGMGGIVRPGDGGEAAAAESADAWQIRVRQAASIAKARGAGKMPGHVERIVSDISTPLVDYAELLRELINSRVAVDYSFSRPNRRFIGQGFYLPGIVADAIDHLVFAVDTSGSIDQTMLANAASEIIGAMETGKVRKLTVIFADAAVKATQEFELGDDIKLAPAGGGGTRFDDTFRWIETNAPDATAAIYLTDMEVGAQHWGEEPSMPVYWAVHGSRGAFDRLASAAPFGEAVYIGRLG